MSEVIAKYSQVDTTEKIIDSTTQHGCKDISDNLIPNVNLHINSTLINGSPDKANIRLQK